jgi:hypothetical protein
VQRSEAAAHMLIMGTCRATARTPSQREGRSASSPTLSQTCHLAMEKMTEERERILIASRLAMRRSGRL